MVSFHPNLRAKNRDYLASGIRRSSQLKSLRIKKKSESRGVLRQKLHLAGCTIIFGAGLGGAEEMGVRPYLPGTGTRYQVPIMYCKTYYTVNTIILSLKAILAFLCIAVR